jgi:hypothetical protein
VKKTGSSTA